MSRGLIFTGIITILFSVISITKYRKTNFLNFVLVISVFMFSVFVFIVNKEINDNNSKDYFSRLVHVNKKEIAGIIVVGSCGRIEILPHESCYRTDSLLYTRLETSLRNLAETNNYSGLAITNIIEICFKNNDRIVCLCLLDKNKKGFMKIISSASEYGIATSLVYTNDELNDLILNITKSVK
jgi:hypothetical protein